jgi:hypothetical protein
VIRNRQVSGSSPLVGSSLSISVVHCRVLRFPDISQGSTAHDEALGSLLGEIQAGAVFGFPLFDRENPSTKASELDQFLLDFLQPFLPLAVGDLSLCFVASVTPILVIQLLKVCDLSAEMPDLFAKNC